MGDVLDGPNVGCVAGCPLDLDVDAFEIEVFN
jgi:hypothetical protein